jgi:acetyl esterase/lipase
MRALVLVVATVALSGCPACGTLYRDRDSVVVENNISYINDGNNQHRLDLYEPTDAVDDTPTVVFVHGGYWNSQDKNYYEFASGLYGNVGVALAREGMRVANINYRLFPEHDLNDMLSDVDAAVSFVRGRFPSAPLWLMGHSAGAHLAASAALLTEGPQTEVDGLVLLSGIFDIEGAVALDPDQGSEVFVPLFGDTPEERATGTVIDELAVTSLPTLFVIGSADYRTIIQDFDVLQEQLSDDDRVSFAVVDGAEHADIVLQIGGEEDEVTPSVVKRIVP